MSIFFPQFLKISGSVFDLDASPAKKVAFSVNEAVSRRSDPSSRVLRHANRALAGLGSGRTAVEGFLRLDSASVGVAAHENAYRSVSVWLAGGRVKAGSVVGAIDETGLQAVAVVHPLKDCRVILLHLLGLDETKDRCLHADREKQLRHMGGELRSPLA